MKVGRPRLEAERRVQCSFSIRRKYRDFLNEIAKAEQRSRSSVLGEILGIALKMRGLK